MRIVFAFFIAALLFSTPVEAQNKVILKKPSKAQCDMLIRNLEQSVERGNHCNQDADCVALDLGCPLPCNTLVHVTDDITHWAVLKHNHDKLCGECSTRCSSPSGTPACVDRKCVYR